MSSTWTRRAETCPEAAGLRAEMRLAHLSCRLLLFLFAALLISACANPLPPSGGPRDTTPPAVVASDPAAGEVNVAAETVRIEFSEYVDRASFVSALTVTPALDEPLAFDWGGRAVEIAFPAPLRDSTTYLLVIDTDFQDAHGVALEAPVTLAFSTGPEIDQGRLAGRVLDARSGAGRGGMDVYAYYAAPDTAAPDSLPESPAYRTQTDSEGRFEFNYLNERPYFVIALADRNRNRQSDPQEAFAAPPRPALVADTVDSLAEEELRWIAAARDTVPPELLRLQAPSDDRLTVRFSEPVRLASLQPGRWQLQDSLQNQARHVRAVFQQADGPQEVTLLTEPLRPALHRLRVEAGAVVDSSGNPLPASTSRFTPPEERDTLLVRFLGFAPEEAVDDTTAASVLLPGTPFGVRFNRPVDTTRLRTLVRVENPSGPPRPFTYETTDGTTYHLFLDPPLGPGQSARVTVDGPALSPDDSLQVQTFRRLSENELGGLSGVVATPDTSGSPVVVELHATSPLPTFDARTTRVDSTGRFLFRGLPEASYRFRAFVDRDEDGRWDAGQLVPYRPAEPVTWSSSPSDVRPRWETALEDTLRILDVGL